MPCRSSSPLSGLRLGLGGLVAVDHVDTLEDAAAQVAVAAVDAGVEECDRDAAPVEAREPGLGPVGRACGDRTALLEPRAATVAG